MITLSVLSYLIIALILASTYQRETYIRKTSFLKRFGIGLLIPLICMIVLIIFILIAKLIFSIFCWLVWLVFWIGTNMP